MKKGKRLLSLFLAVVMALGCFPVSAAESPVDTGEIAEAQIVKEASMELMASYDMSSADGKLLDITGNGFDAAYTGFAAEDFVQEGEDTVLTFDGTGNYISLPAGMIESETFAIEATFQTNTLNGGWLWTLGTREAYWPNVNNYLFMAPMFGGEGVIRAGIMDASAEQLFGNAGTVSGTDYVTVRVAFDQGDLELYVDNELRSTLSTGYSIQQILEDGTSDGLCGYIGRSLFTPDPEFTGKLTQFDVYAVPVTDATKIEADLAALDIPNADDVRGNITLPETGANGSTITWTSDDADGIISLETVGKKAPGVVTRPAEDTVVNLTATLTLGEETRTKEFALTVKAAPGEIELTDYIFATFQGDGGIPQQQVLFSISRDGNHWLDMNNNEPILSVADATEGDKGVRDPFLFRSHEGDKFYLIATDLCIGSGEGTHDWGTAQSKTESSKNIRIWESYDLVHWSEPWLAEIGVPNSNFTWAPEAIWDEESGQYMVYWAVGGSTTDGKPQETSRTYYCMTRDFHTFTEPQIFSENMTDYTKGQIDTSILYLGDNTYVRTSSSSPDIPIEISKNGLFGDWERITNLQALGLGVGAGGNTTPGLTIVEGPELFAYNEDDWIVEDGVAVPTWGIIVDNYGGKGYIPFATTDFFSTIPAGQDGAAWYIQDYDFDSLKRHGTIMPITTEEYEAFVAAYGGQEAGTIASSVTVGAMPEVSTGLDDHTAVWSEMENNVVSSYIKRYTLDEATGKQTATDLTQVPVTFTINSLYADVAITLDGQSFTNGSAVDLTQDRTFRLQSDSTVQEITVKTPKLATNAVLPGQLSDPDIDYFDGRYWIFPTTDGFGGWSGTQFHAFSAESLEGPWQDEGVILETNRNAAASTNTVHNYPVPVSEWSVGSAWAPSIEKIGEKYYFFYCAKLPDGNSCIGVAVADEPYGPYVPQDEPLVERIQGGITVGQAIDPSVFADDDGTLYLYYGNGNPAVAEFTVDETTGTVSMVEGTYRLLEGLDGFRESVTVNKIGDTYHFLWSVDDTGSPNYSVYYGTSDSPYGPVEYHYPLLQKDESMGILGTAHQSAVIVNGNFYLAYHRFYTPLGFYPNDFGVHRETCVNQVPVGSDGLLLPIVPTMEGVSGDIVLRDGTIWDPDNTEAAPIPEALYAEDFDDADYAEGTTLNADAAVQDGVLVLDGSDAYLSLPEGLLNGTNQATISFDVKSETTDWNFFTFALGQDDIKYLFVRTRQNDIYTGITQNSYGAEDGATVNIPVYNEWRNYTIVLNGNNYMVYVDGMLRGVQSSTRTALEDLGPDAKIWFGKSFFAADPYFKGQYDNIQIWDTALTQAQISQMTEDTRLAYAVKALDIPNAEQIREDIDLPTTGAYGAQIVWSSNDADGIIDLATGKVTRPTDGDKTVHLTATITLGGLEATKEFTLTVMQAPSLTDADRLTVPYYVTAEYQLPTTVGNGATVTWDKELVTPANGISAQQTLTATITAADGSSEEKVFQVYVLGADAVELLGYTRTNEGTIGASLHLAAKDGSTYEALNSNYGVLFPESDFTTSTAGLPRGLTDACIFRMEDGSFGIVAQRTLDDGTIDRPGQMLFFTSEDLLQYEEIGLIEISEESALNDLTCSYDSSEDCYRIVWTDDAGQTFCRTTTDFETFTGQTEWYAIDETLPQTTISGAVEQTVIAVTAEEYAAIESRLGRVYAVSAEDAEVSIGAGTDLAALEDTRVTVQYSDGSTAEKRVEWDLSEIDTSIPGTYTVEGTLVQNDFPFPMMVNRADPCVIYWEGMYYFIATDDYQGSQCNLYIRGSETLEGLKDTTGTVITGNYQDGWWTANSYMDENDHLLWDGIHTENNDHYGIHWAPELHAITDSNGETHLYCFFAMRASVNDGRYAPQAYVAKLKDGGDPLQAEDWEEPIRVQKQNGEYLSENEGITLDMTYFEVDGVSYVCWSQPKDSPAAGLYIATVDKDMPWKLTSEQVHIAWPTYRWERGIVGDDAAVNEGANVIIHDGKVYMVFSGSRVGSDYATGMMMADVGADLLDPDSWTKSNYPWMHNGVLDGQNGLGHNSFFVDEYGDLYNIYHAVGTDGRASTIVPVHFRADGTPILDMKPSEELPADRTVTMTVHVGNTAVCTADAAIRTENQRDDTGRAEFQLNLRDAVEVATVQVTFTTTSRDVILHGANDFVYLNIENAALADGSYEKTVILAYLPDEGRGATFSCTGEETIATLAVGGSSPEVTVEEVLIYGYDDMGHAQMGGMVTIDPDHAVFTEEVQPTEYTVTVETDGNGTASADPASAAAGTEITLTATASSGYHFKAWQVVDGDVTIENNRFTMPQHNVTVKAIFEKDSTSGGGSTGGGTTGGSTGSTTETVTNPDGSTTTIVTKPDGSKTETTKAPDGSSSVVNTSEDGKVEATVTVSSSAVEQAEDFVTLPMPAVHVTDDLDTAPEITVDLPDDTTVMVEIPVEDVTAGTVAVMVHDDGTTEVIQTTITTENGVAVELEDGDTIKIVENSKDFIDVPDSFWGADAVDFVTSRELFNGTSATTFSPNGDMTRAMIVTVLARMEGVDTSAGDTWYEVGRQWAMDNGISDGTNMMDSLTREQLATMLYRYVGEPAVSGTITGFSDVEKVSDWAEDAMLWAVQNGIISGKGDRLDPQGDATRAEVATMLMRFCNML